MITEGARPGADREFLSNDSEVRYALSQIYNRGNLARNYRTVSSAETLDYRVGTVVITGASSFVLTLPKANYWGTTKSPDLMIYHGGTGTVTLAATAPDAFHTLLGTLTVRPGDMLRLFSDGTSTWIVVQNNFQTGSSTPTPTSGSGTLTTASATVNWTRLNNRVTFDGTATITTNGTGATSIVVGLPFTPAAEQACYGYNRSSVYSLAAFTSGASIILLKYDGTYPAASGTILYFGGTVRI